MRYAVEIESDEMMVTIPMSKYSELVESATHCNELTLTKDEYNLLRESKMLFNMVCDIYRRRLKNEIDAWDADRELAKVLGELIASEGEVGGKNE